MVPRRRARETANDMHTTRPPQETAVIAVAALFSNRATDPRSEPFESAPGRVTVFSARTVFDVDPAQNRPGNGPENDYAGSRNKRVSPRHRE